jgi:hypothetical protein
MPGGRRRDTIYYSMLEDEWPARRETVFSGCAGLRVLSAAASSN